MQKKFQEQNQSDKSGHNWTIGWQDKKLNATIVIWRSVPTSLANLPVKVFKNEVIVILLECFFYGNRILEKNADAAGPLGD